MSETPIHEDGQSTDVETQVETQEATKSQRQRVIDDIAERRRASLTPSEEPTETKEAEEDEEDLVEIRVDGETRKIPRDEVLKAGLAAVQKQSAADRRLQEASLERQRLERERQEFEAQRQRYEEERKSRQVDSPENDIEAQVKEALEGIYEGDSEASAKKLAALITARKEQTGEPINPAQIAQQAAHLARLQADTEQADDIFSSEYTEIRQDQRLYSLAQQRAVAIAQSEPHKSRVSIARQVGDEMREWLSGFKGSGSDREIAKRQATDTTRAAGARRPSPPEKKPPTRAEVIREMQKARGQRV